MQPLTSSGCAEIWHIYCKKTHCKKTMKLMTSCKFEYTLILVLARCYNAKAPSSFVPCDLYPSKSPYMVRCANKIANTKAQVLRGPISNNWPNLVTKLNMGD